jgi:hypothetical protein
MSYIGGGHRPMAVGNPAAARLDELLEQIRMTFDSVSQDVEHSKSQHNDYERRGNNAPRLPRALNMQG